MTDESSRSREDQLLGITREERDGALILGFVGEADMSTAGLVQANLASASGSGLTVLDLSELTFVDSTTISLWIHARQNALESGGHIRIAGAVGIVAQVLQISGLDSFFVLADSVDEALHASEEP